MGSDGVPPLTKESSGALGSRSAAFFNPELVSPTPTQGFTPEPGSKDNPLLPEKNRKPWAVSSPLPTRLEAGVAAGFVASPGSWFHRNLSRRGPCSIALAILLGAVLFFAILGVSWNWRISPGVALEIWFYRAQDQAAVALKAA